MPPKPPDEPADNERRGVSPTCPPRKPSKPVQLRQLYLVQIECTGVKEQQRLYRELTQRGHKVRILTT